MSGRLLVVSGAIGELLMWMPRKEEAEGSERQRLLVLPVRVNRPRNLRGMFLGSLRQAQRWDQ